MVNFDDIRPYEDHEVRPTIKRLLKDKELLQAVARFRFPVLSQKAPWLMRPIVQLYLRKQFGGVSTVHEVQTTIERYVKRMLDTSSRGLTVSGIEKLDPKQNYLFISNHRDITMDPACVNWVLFHHGFTTLRIAIGDNLLSKPYVSDLMRLNKTFIVNRSAKSPREKLKAAKHLSAYIFHSLSVDQSNIWIAQREGRAKDGRDITNPAIINMLTLNRPKTEAFGEYVKTLKIVPIAISYEWDPCDAAKARELYQTQVLGKYVKAEHEDVASIAAGISGQKGRIHLAFGDVLGNNFESAEDVAAELERQIQSNYQIHPSNLAAYIRLHGESPDILLAKESFEPAQYKADEEELLKRVSALPQEQREIFLAGYANPVVAKFALQEQARDPNLAVSHG